MKICILRPLFGISGVDSTIINLALELQKNNEVLFLVGTNYHFLGLNSIYSKILADVLRKKITEKQIRDLTKKLSEYDIVILPSAQRNENHMLVKAIKKYCKKTKLVNRCGNPLKNSREVKITKLCDLNIVSSKLIKEDLLKKSIGSHKVVLIRNPIPDRFRQINKNKVKILKRKYGIKGHVLLYPTRVFSYYKGLETRKGLIIILKSFEKIINEEDNIYLVIGGNDPFHKQCYNTIKNLKKQLCKLTKERIIFLDEKDCNYYNFHIAVQMADIILHPNVSREPFGTAVAESMAAKKPVIITPSVGAIEITHTKKYFLNLRDKSKADIVVVPPNNVEELTNVVLFLLKNQKLRKQIGMNAARTIKHFTTEIYAKKVLNLLQLITEI